jgi:hypothetical protein
VPTCPGAFSVAIGRLSATLHGFLVVRDLVDDAEYWRDRAENAREYAASIKDKRSREIMLRVAAEYAQMAKRADEISRRRKKSQ